MDNSTQPIYIWIMGISDTKKLDRVANQLNGEVDNFVRNASYQQGGMVSYFSTLCLGARVENQLNGEVDNFVRNASC